MSATSNLSSTNDGPPASSPKPPVASIEVEASKARVAANVHKNATAHVVLPPLDDHNDESTTYDVEPAHTDVLEPLPGFPGYFKAAAAGTATVVVRQHLPCAAARLCSDKPIEIGSVVLRVLGS